MDCSLPGSFCPWDFPGKNAWVGCHFLLQGIFWTQRWKPGLLHWQADSFTIEPPGVPQIRHCYVAKSLQSCPTLCDPIDGSPPGSPVPGILQARTMEWAAISFSNAWKWKWKGSRSVVSDSSQPLGLQPTRLLRLWDFPGKSTGVGCHFLLQCMKVKSEREVTQSCPTLRDPMDCSLPGSSIHGIFQARVLEWGAIAFSELYVKWKQILGSSEYM